MDRSASAPNAAVAFYPRVFDVIYISTWKGAAKLCRQVNELIPMEYSSAQTTVRLILDKGSVTHKFILNSK